MDISAAIEGTGGGDERRNRAGTHVYWCKVAQPYFAESLDLLFDMLRNSLYRPDDVEMERGVVQEELAMINDYPTARVDSLIDEMLWPDHPLGRDIAGTKESVAGITREMMLNHAAEYYTPANVVVSIAGNIPHSQVVALSAEFSDGWHASPPPAPPPVTRMQDESQLRLEYRGTEQVHMSIALPGLSLDHPDRYALDLLSVILGEGMSSRLFVELREKRGLAYDIHSGVAHFKDTGAFIISAGVDPSNTYEAVPGHTGTGSGGERRPLRRGDGQGEAAGRRSHDAPHGRHPRRRVLDGQSGNAIVNHIRSGRRGRQRQRGVLGRHPPRRVRAARDRQAQHGGGRPVPRTKAPDAASETLMG